MSATGLDVFDKTLQTTHIWLNDITEVIGPDKQVAWHVLGAVLRTLRDRVPLQVAAHLGALQGAVRGGEHTHRAARTCQAGRQPGRLILHRTILVSGRDPCRFR